MKTCINMDARAYEFMAEKFPEVAARLKKYLAAGKVELIAGTYGQPMGTTIGGESNIRQMVVGRETDPQGARLRLGHVPRRRGVHPSADSAVGRRWPATATPAWPSWTPGAGPAAPCKTSMPSTGRDGRDDDPLRAEERAVRRPGRREATGRVARVQEAASAGQAADVHLGGVRLGHRPSSRPISPPRPGTRRWPPRATSNSSPFSEYLEEVRRPGQGNDLSADGRLGQVAHLGTRRRSGADSRSQGGVAAVGRRSLRRGRLVAGRRLAMRPARQGVDETSWPRKATTWDCASLRVGKAT